MGRSAALGPAGLASCWALKGDLGALRTARLGRLRQRLQVTQRAPSGPLRSPTPAGSQHRELGGRCTEHFRVSAVFYTRAPHLHPAPRPGAVSDWRVPSVARSAPSVRRSIYLRINLDGVTSSPFPVPFFIIVPLPFYKKSRKKNLTLLHPYYHYGALL